MHDLGDVVPLTIETRDAAGVLANAGVVTLTLTLPDQTAVTPSVINPSTGRYQVDYPTTQVGRHNVRWLATGLHASAYVDSFDVRPAVVNGIISLSDARDILRFTGTTLDEDLRWYVEAATDIIERYIQQTVVRRSYTETHFDVRYGQDVVLNHYPVISITNLSSVDGLRAWSVSGFYADKDTGTLVRLPGGGLLWGDVVITYVAGRVSIPANYQVAAKIIIQHLWSTRRGMGSAPALGRFGEFATPVGLGFALPNAAKELLGTPGVPLVG